MRILILGGTGEARELAAELVAAGSDVISSLAGRVREPRLPDGPVRVGGFGGADGLASFLREEGITHVIDATHPFAGSITANAARAAREASVPLLVLRRPEWEAVPSWDTVPDIQAAAAAVRAWAGEGVFLTTGRRDLDAFAADDGHRFLVRTVDPPDGPVPSRMTLLLDRGPYTVESESALMREHEIGLLVTKNSGGPMTAAKLQAARDLGVQVVMVRRPALPPGGAVAATVAEALHWLRDLERITGERDSARYASVAPWPPDMTSATAFASAPSTSRPSASGSAAPPPEVGLRPRHLR